MLRACGQVVLRAHQPSSCSAACLTACPCRYQSSPKDLQEGDIGEVYRVACHVIERLAILGEQYSLLRNASAGHVVQWTDAASSA